MSTQLETEADVKHFWTLTDPESLSLLGGSRSGAGIAVNDYSALGLPPFFKAKKLIGEMCAKLFCPVLIEGKNGSKTVAKDHPLHFRLNYRANDFMSAIDCRAKVISDAVGHGNGWAWIDRKNNLALYPLDPQNTYIEYRWTPGQMFPDFINVVTYRFGGNRLVLPYADVLHVRGLGFSMGLLGVNLLDCAREALGLGLATISYGSHFYGNDCQPGYWVEVPGNLNEKQVQDLKKGLKQMHKGVDNAGEPGVLSNGAKINQPGQDNRKNQWVESMEIIAIAVANLTGIPPHKLGCNVNTSYSSLEQENVAFLSECLDPWMCKLEAELWAKGLTESEKRSQKYLVSHNREDFIRTDTVASIEGDIKELQAGVINRNTYNERRKRPSMGPEGDRYYINTSFTFDDMPDYDPDLQREKQENPPEPPVAQEPDQDDSEEKLNKLKASVLDRYIKRLTKSLTETKRYSEYVRQSFRQNHYDVMVETLTPITDRAAEISADFFASIGPELEAITQDQCATVLQTHKEQLWEKLNSSQM